MLRVAACQILTYPDTSRSADKICSWIEKAANAEVDVVVFPEATICGYACEREYWAAAKPEDFARAEEQVVAELRERRLAAVIGTAHWEGRKVYNSVLAVDRGGKVRGRYAKTYLAEAWPNPGQALPVYELAGVPSSFIICHDIRYPELVRLPAIAGARICYYSSNESGLLEEHKLSAYRAMPISRATENTIYLVMANAPADPDNLRSTSQSHGNSKVIHPDGIVLEEAGHFEERLVIADIDLDKGTGAMATRSAAEQTIIAPWLRDGARLVGTRHSIPHIAPQK
jgi:predicted amidohydrolase